MIEIILACFPVKISLTWQHYLHVGELTEYITRSGKQPQQEGKALSNERMSEYMDTCEREIIG